MKRINKNIYPSGGHFFVESDGAKIFGDTWAGVIARVALYRKRAQLPVGNPEEEVINQACQRSPHICHEVDGVTKRARIVASLKGRVLRWMAEIRKRGSEALVFVSEDVRKIRAATCAACSENQPLPGGCATCRAAVAELRKEIIGKRPVDGRLNACAILGEDLSSATNFEQPAEDNPGLPAHCWRKRKI